MAVFFNEGLPGSGKSYEAMVRFVAKALEEGRPVDAYIKGLDHDKIAAAVGLSVDRVRELLQPIAEEQVPTFYEHVRKNSLVVLDEAQNFWPAGRQRLDSKTTSFITEHRHTGNDILLMGQCFDDVHKLWRNRTKARFVFHKLDNVGLEKRYSVKTLTATAPGKFSETSFSANEKYDERWFGTYASHDDDTIRTENYKDARVSIWNTFVMKWMLPVSVVGAVWGGWTIYKYFGGHSIPKHEASTATAAPASAGSAPPARVDRIPDARPLPQKNLVVELTEKYRPRLAGYWQVGKRTGGTIEFWEGKELRESLTFDQIRRLGIPVAASDNLAILGTRYVTSWPRPREPGSSSWSAPEVLKTAQPTNGS